jgi:sugar phosphate permease
MVVASMEQKMKDKNKIRTMAILISVYVVAYLCRKGASFAAPYLLDFFGASKMQWANLVALTSAAYGVGKFILPAVADKKKANAIMLGSFSIVCGVATAAMGLASVWAFFLAAFVLMCFFQGQALPNSVSLICKTVSVENRSIAYTIWSASHKIGTLLAGVLASFFIAKNFISGVFFLPAVLSVVVGVAVLIWIKDSRDGTSSSSLKKEKLSLKREVYLNFSVLKISGAAFFLYMAYVLMADMGVLFFVAKGFERADAVTIMIYFSSLAFLGGLICSVAAKKLFGGRVIAVVQASAVIMALCFFAMSLFSPTTSMPVVFVAMVFSGMVCDVIQIMPSAISTLVVDKAYAASTTGYVGLWQQAGLILGAYLVAGLLTHSNPNYCSYLAAACCLIAAAVLATLKKKKNKFTNLLEEENTYRNC